MVETSIMEAGWESESSLRSWEISFESTGLLSDPIELIAPGLDAMCQLAEGLFEPQVVRTEIGWLDIELGFKSGYAPHMEWMLSRSGIDNRWWPVAETLEEVDEIDRIAVDRFLRRACSQTGELGMVACPMHVEFSRVRARVLDPVPTGVRGFQLIRRRGPAVALLERVGDEVWVVGPQDGFITAPVEARLLIDGADLTLRISAHWSPWADPDRPGTRAIEERIARLVSSGWELVE